jgi:hypothetical protein
MKKIILCLFCACFLHFSAFAECRTISLREAIFESSAIVYAEVSFEAGSEKVSQTKVQMNIIQTISGKLKGKLPVIIYFSGTSGARVVEKETIKGIFFLSTKRKNEWHINGIGCYNNYLLVDAQNQVILNENPRYPNGESKDKRVTISDFKAGIALFLRGLIMKETYKNNKNKTYQALMQNRL